MISFIDKYNIKILFTVVGRPETHTYTTHFECKNNIGFSNDTHHPWLWIIRFQNVFEDRFLKNEKHCTGHHERHNRFDGIC